MNFVLQEGLYNFNLHLMMLNFSSSVSVTVWDDQNVPNVKITILWFIEPQSTNDLWMCIYVCVCVCVYEWESLSHVQLCDCTLARLLCPWYSLAKNIGDSLLQGIFLTQGLNLALLHCRQILYYLSQRRYTYTHTYTHTHTHTHTHTYTHTHTHPSYLRI